MHWRMHGSPGFSGELENFRKNSDFSSAWERGYLPPHPPMKVVWGGVSEGVIPYALMQFHASRAGRENTNTEI